jgi:hypothetical protein
MRGHATLPDEMRETIAGIPKQVQASVERPILPNVPFFTHWDEFVATKKSDRKWKRDTADGAEATPRLFKALIGDLPLAEIDGSVVGRFRIEYLKLPFDHFHGKKWNKLTTKQVLAAVQKRDDAAKAKLRRDPGNHKRKDRRLEIPGRPRQVNAQRAEPQGWARYPGSGT